MGQFHVVRFINPSKDTKELALTLELIFALTPNGLVDNVGADRPALFNLFFFDAGRDRHSAKPDNGTFLDEPKNEARKSIVSRTGFPLRTSPLWGLL